MIQNFRSYKEGKPGVPPMASQSAQIPEGKQGAPGGVESTTPPADVAIGDSQQTINQVRQGLHVHQHAHLFRQLTHGGGGVL